MSQTTATVQVDQSVTLTATARDANGHVISGASPTWSSSNTSVATVNSTGRVTGRAEGTATITASLSGETASAVVTVTGSTNPPPPPPSGAWFSWDWTRFNSTQEMRAAAGYCCGGTVTLESGTLPDGSQGKFMRAHLRGDGTEDHTDYDIYLPPGAREIWLEFWLRFDDNWTTRSDDKTFFLYSNSQGARRWELHYGPDRGNYSYAGVGASATEWIVSSVDIQPVRLNVPSRVWDGQWHRHRIYARMSSSSTASDGALYWWFDDTVLLSATVGDVWNPSKKGEGVRTTNQPSDYFHSIRLGANADPQGSGIRDWGPIRIWTTNPGW